MSDEHPLREYRRKRDVRTSSEPSGGTDDARRDPPRFVVQKHGATSLHSDFRLEADGVLISWAVPKGPPTDPRAQRLAVPTEEHPLDHGEFEGTIPQGEYGAGTVILRDAGTYRSLTESDGREVPAAQAVERRQ